MSFTPERWTDELEKNYYSISFNQGPQKCPGKELAIFLIKSFIVNFLFLSGCVEKGYQILKTSKINTKNITQMINPCKIQIDFS